MAGIPNLLLVFLFFSVSSAATNCSYTCGNQTIRFPFSVGGRTSGCGYPGFSLTCKAQETLLSLPGSGDFLVREINYTTQSIRVSDQGNCLPRRLIGFNLSGSPFLADFSANSTLYSCPKQLIESLGFPTIACLGNSTHSVVALLNGTVIGSTVTGRCQKMDTWMTDVVELRWDLPQCQDCEANNGTCGFDNDHNQIVCYPNSDKGGSKQGSTNDQVFKIIALSITIPAMLCSVGVGIFLCAIDSREALTRQTAVNPQLEPTIDGLDQATIDSYTKVVLGESKRVPGPNKDVCPICLSDFSPNETLRCIPECQHCFHADCIDEWLRLKGTCPLCRKSPSPLHEIVVEHISPG